MASAKHTPFSSKHDPSTPIDPSVQAEIKAHISGDELPCAVAFEVARKLGVAPGEIGKTADLMNLRLTKCQLGLFGYRPNKKIVSPQVPEAELKQALLANQRDNRLACIGTWKIAAELGLNKLAVSGACEALNIRIKPCQLGAF